MFFTEQQQRNKKVGVDVKNDHKSKSEYPIVGALQKDNITVKAAAAMQKDEWDGHKYYPTGEMQDD